MTSRTAATPPLVDVSLISYNHEQFIAQAIESVLAQRTDFPFRIIIGDDCSSDGTQAIITRYALNHPDRITTLFDSEHRGLGRKDRVGMKVFKFCTAKYVAMLDGDDYWTDPYKLQKQVDFLNAHPECAICFHDATVFYEDASRPPQNFCRRDQKEISTLEDLLCGNFILTCSVMFRSGLFTDFPDAFHSSKTTDWQIHILNAQHGKIGYLDQVMAAYRVHRGGAWSLLNSAERLLDGIRLLDDLDTYFGRRYRRYIRTTQSRYYDDLSDAYDAQRNPINARAAARNSLLLCLSNRRAPSQRLIRKVLRLHMPPVHRVVRWLRSLAHLPGL